MTYQDQIQVGDRKHLLTAIDVAAPYIHKDGHKRTRILCVCECGTERAVSPNEWVHDKVKSCGCLNSATRRRAATYHGYSKNKDHPKHFLYAIWKAMVARCHNPKNPAWRRYGGRGITVCERWHDMENFFADVGPRPSPQHSLDRIDNDGPYSPENCRWATKIEQAYNKQNTTIYTWTDLSLNLLDWCRRAEMPLEVVRSRMSRGWAFETALSTPAEIQL